MADGFKRGGFRGRGNSGFKKGYARKRSPEDDDDARRGSKKSKGNDYDDKAEDTTPIVPKLQTDDDNNPFIALNHSGKRRVTVSDFKDMTLVSIREYWVNDGGELKPGKKGISLPIEQYNALLAAAPLLESVLSKKSIQVARPDYEKPPNAPEAVEEEEEGEEKEKEKREEKEEETEEKEEQ